MLKFYTINAIALTIFTLMFVGGYFQNIPIWMYILLILIWISITAIGTFQIKWNYHLNSLNRNKNISENSVAITFDDGPNPEFTPKVLSLLKKHDAIASFFITGKNAKKYPDLVKQIVAEGHTIANHSYSHSKNFSFFSSEKIIAELNKTDTIIQEVTGKTPKLFRPPYGVTNPNIKKALKNTEHQSIGWSKRSLDTLNISKEKVLKRITKDLKRGDVVLLHDNSLKSAEVLEQLLIFLDSQKMRSVSVDHLLDIKAYA